MQRKGSSNPTSKSESKPKLLRADSTSVGHEIEINTRCMNIRGCEVSLESFHKEEEEGKRNTHEINSI